MDHTPILILPAAVRGKLTHKTCTARDGNVLTLKCICGVSRKVSIQYVLSSRFRREGCPACPRPYLKGKRSNWAPTWLVDALTRAVRDRVSGYLVAKTYKELSLGIKTEEAAGMRPEVSALPCASGGSLDDAGDGCDGVANQATQDKGG